MNSYKLTPVWCTQHQAQKSQGSSYCILPFIPFCPYMFTEAPSVPPPTIIHENFIVKIFVSSKMTRIFTFTSNTIYGKYIVCIDMNEILSQTFLTKVLLTKLIHITVLEWACCLTHSSCWAHQLTPSTCRAFWKHAIRPSASTFSILKYLARGFTWPAKSSVWRSRWRQVHLRFCQHQLCHL